jgi:hypothetical protein
MNSVEIKGIYYTSNSKVYENILSILDDSSKERFSKPWLWLEKGHALRNSLHRQTELTRQCKIPRTAATELYCAYHALYTLRSDFNDNGKDHLRNLRIRHRLESLFKSDSYDAKREIDYYTAHIYISAFFGFECTSRHAKEFLDNVFKSLTLDACCNIAQHILLNDRFTDSLDTFRQILTSLGNKFEFSEEKFVDIAEFKSFKRFMSFVKISNAYTIKTVQTLINELEEDYERIVKENNLKDEKIEEENARKKAFKNSKKVRVIKDSKAEVSKEFKKLRDVDCALLALKEPENVFKTLDIEFPWMAKLTNYFRKQHYLSTHSFDPFFYSRPVMLVGPPGVGKSKYMARFGELSGIPASTVMLAGSGGVLVLKGVDAGYSSERPGFVIEMINRHQIANPIIMLDEVDKSIITAACNKCCYSFLRKVQQENMLILRLRLLLI